MLCGDVLPTPLTDEPHTCDHRTGVIGPRKTRPLIAKFGGGLGSSIECAREGGVGMRINLADPPYQRKATL